MGAIQLRRKKSRREWDQIKRDVDAVLDRFYMARIGLRFLLEHHVTCSPEYRQQGQGGIIQSDCSPLAVAELAAADAKLLCEHHLGDCPDITYQCAPAPPPSAAPTASEQRRRGCLLGAGSGHTGIQLTYVPMHLHYMLFEVLKNSTRASVEHCLAHDLDLAEHPVKVIMADGREDITIKVSDEGGGIPRSEIGDVWTYLHSTAKAPARLHVRAPPPPLPRLGGVSRRGG